MWIYRNIRIYCLPLNTIGAPTSTPTAEVSILLQLRAIFLLKFSSGSSTFAIEASGAWPILGFEIYNRYSCPTFFLFGENICFMTVTSCAIYQPSRRFFFSAYLYHCIHLYCARLYTNYIQPLLRAHT